MFSTSVTDFLDFGHGCLVMFGISLSLLLGRLLLSKVGKLAAQLIGLIYFIGNLGMILLGFYWAKDSFSCLSKFIIYLFYFILLFYPIYNTYLIKGIIYQ
jgi:hypothetical protein